MSTRCCFSGLGEALFTVMIAAESHGLVLCLRDVRRAARAGSGCAGAVLAMAFRQPYGSVAVRSRPTALHRTADT